MTVTLRTAITLMALALLAGCHEPGPAERAGQSLDNAAARTRDAVDPPSNAADKAGREIDRTLNPGPGARTGRTLDKTTE